MLNRIFTIFALLTALSLQTFAQTVEIGEISEQMRNQDRNLNHRLDKLEKLVDDVLWQQKVGDVAFIDKLIYLWSTAMEREKSNLNECW
jgi:hypothetical protein